MGVVEAVEEPAEGVGVFGAVLRHREVARVARFENELGGRELEHIDDLAPALARQQECADRLNVGGLRRTRERVKQHPGFGGRQRRLVREQAALGRQFRRSADGGLLALVRFGQLDPGDFARHLVV